VAGTFDHSTRFTLFGLPAALNDVPIWRCPTPIEPWKPWWTNATAVPAIESITTAVIVRTFALRAMGIPFG